MADALLSAVLTQLAWFIDHKVRKDLRQVLGSKKEVQKLRSTFEAIRAVIDDAERRQVKEHAVKLWVHKLNDISHEIEDELDEISTAILKSQIQEFQARAGLHKVSHYISSSWLNFTRTFLLRRQTAVRIKELTERLDVIASEKDRYNLKLSGRNCNDIGFDQRQRTTSFVDVSEVRGRQQARRTAISMLLCGSSREESYRIISIVGIGGIGKTTLAQLVYHSDEVMTHFDERIWVHVSDPFDEIRIARAIIEALQGVTPNLLELESLLRQICGYIKGRKFLLVLDDVWNEDYMIWEQLKQSLKCGAQGSRILVTTRKETVVRMFGSANRFSLGKLPEQDCWSIFSQAAFLGKDSEEYEKFKDIGRQIAAKCNGLPLAAKYLGNLLRLKGARQDWQNVLDSEIWELEDAETISLFPPLLFSYYDLPSAMRRCFSYCAIFPKNYMMKKDKLIKMWVSQGFLDSAGKSIDMETMGLQCFENLAMHSFFQEFQRDEDDGSIIGCCMHDIVHDFAHYLMKDKSMIVQELEIGSACRKTNHLTLILGSQASFPISIYNLENLRTLLILDGPNSGTSKVPPELFLHLKRLRTLDMSGCLIDCLPREIGNCIHLRYLNLSLNDQLQELTEALCELCNLQTLDLHLCRRLQSLPKGMERLIKLRHLEIDGTYSLSILPKGIGKLTALRTLSNFIVGDAGACGACGLGELKDLNQLHGYLSIEKLGKITNVSDAEKAQLRNKRHLSELKLDFSGEKEGIMNGIVLEALQPPLMIEILVIKRYNGTFSPGWLMQLTKLRKLQLHHFTECTCLPSLGNLPSLEWLDIGGMSRLRNVGCEILGIETSGQMTPAISFPKLKHLRFWSMREWEEWDGITSDKDVAVMPCASSLQLIDCPRLKALPNYLQKVPLQELSMAMCPTLKQRCWKEDRAKISHIPNIEIDYLHMRVEDTVQPKANSRAGVHAGNIVG